MLTNFQLTSKRLRLLPIRHEDHQWFLALNQHPVVRKFLWDDQIISSHLAGEIMEHNQQYFKDSAWGLWKLIDSRQVAVGYAGLWYFFDEPQPQLMYVVDPKHQRQGLATEAARSIINYAFNVLQFDYLWAAMEQEHSASAKVALACGMSFLKQECIDGKETCFYQILKS